MPYQNPYMPAQALQPQGFQPHNYQPQGYMTAGASPMLAQQPIHGFVYVTGLDGAKAFQMPPNSEMPLFNAGGDVMYIKTTDGAGFPTIKVCDVSERTGTPDAQGTEYVTRDELQRVYADLSAQMEQMKGVAYGTVPAAADTTEQPAGANARHSANDGR